MGTRPHSGVGWGGVGWGRIWGGGRCRREQGPTVGWGGGWFGEAAGVGGNEEVGSFPGAAPGLVLEEGD